MSDDDTFTIMLDQRVLDQLMYGIGSRKRRGRHRVKPRPPWMHTGSGRLFGTLDRIYWNQNH